MIRFFIIILDHWGPGRAGFGGMVGGSAHSKVGITDTLGIKGTHGDLMHRGEVGLDHIDTFHVSLVMDTEVLLEVESVLGHPERVPHIGLDTLVTCELSGFGRLVWVAGSPGLADVPRPVNKEVLDDHVEHPDVAVGQVLKALLYILLAERGAVFLTDSLLDAGGMVPDDVAYPPHLMSALITSDHGPSLRGGLHQGQAGNSQHESQHPRFSDF